EPDEHLRSHDVSPCRLKRREVKMADFSPKMLIWTRTAKTASKECVSLPPSNSTRGKDEDFHGRVPFTRGQRRLPIVQTYEIARPGDKACSGGDAVLHSLPCPLFTWRLLPAMSPRLWAIRYAAAGSSRCARWTILLR